MTCGGGGTSGLPRPRSTSGSPPRAAASWTRASSRMKYCSGSRSSRRGRLIAHEHTGHKERGGSLRPDSARPGRCNRSVNVPCVGTLTLLGQNNRPAPGRKLRKFLKTRPLESRAKALRRHVDRRLGTGREGDEHVSAGRRDPPELVEERNHVPQRDEVEGAAREGQLLGVAHLEVDARR